METEIIMVVANWRKSCFRSFVGASLRPGHMTFIMLLFCDQTHNFTINKHCSSQNAPLAAAVLHGTLDVAAADPFRLSVQENFSTNGDAL